MHKVKMVIIILGMALLFNSCTGNPNYPMNIFMNKNPVAYGEMWNKSDSGFIVIDLVTSDVYVQITGLNESFMKDVSVLNSNMTVNQTGIYSVSAHVSMETAGARGEYGLKIFKNDEGQESCYSHAHITGDAVGICVDCFLSLNASDVLNMRIDDHANPVIDVTLLSATMNIRRID